VNLAGMGILVDYTTGHVDPSEGYRIEANLMSSGRLTASDYSFTRLNTEAKGYFSPLGNLVIAQKIQFQMSWGSPPVYELPVLGYEAGLRGYVSNRFRDQRLILHILELRSWFLNIRDDTFRLGGILFMDTGSVFPKGRFPDSLTQTFGIAGVVSILNPDFILRGEIAFSDEISRLYFGLGFLF
jgi:hypothetical protein